MALRSRVIVILGFAPLVACSALTDLDPLRGDASPCSACDGGPDSPVDDASSDAPKDGDAAVVTPTGTLTNLVTWGAANYDGVTRVRVDSKGNVYVLAIVSANGATFTINNGKVFQPGVSSPWMSMLAKFLPNGDCDWVLPLPATNLSGLALDPSETSVYVAGGLLGSTTLGSSPLTLLGGQDLVTLKVSTSGVVQWAQNFGQPQGVWTATSVLADSSNVYVAGSMRWASAVKIGSVSPTAPATSNNGSYGYVVALTPAGTPSWARVLAPSTTALARTSTINDLVLAKNGDLLVGGWFSDSNTSIALELDPGATNTKLQRAASASGFVGDAFVAAYRPASSGQFVWGTQLMQVAAPAGQSMGIVAMTPTPAGELYVGLSYSGPVALAIGGNLPDSGYSNIGVAKLDAAGKVLAIKGYPAAKSAQSPFGLSSIAVDGAGDVIFGGTLSNDADFGTGPVAYSGYGDAFVVKVDASLKPRWIKTYAPQAQPDAGPGYWTSANTVAVLPSGGAVVGGTFLPSTKFDATIKDTNGRNDAFLAFLKP